jgi:hypothetical protein
MAFEGSVPNENWNWVGSPACNSPQSLSSTSGTQRRRASQRMHPHVTPKAESDQRAPVSFTAAMNHQTGTGVAPPAVKAVAPENVLSKSAEEA